MLHRAARRALLFLTLLVVPLLSACSDSMVALLPDVPLPASLRPVETVDKPSGIIQQALSACPKRMEAGEAACVQEALAQHHITVDELARIVPGCSVEHACETSYTTDDRIGYFGLDEAHYIVRWRVTFNLTHPSSGANTIAVTVRQIETRSAL